MRVLVCGGRDFKDDRAVFTALDHIDLATPFSLVITGGARGVDSHADRWAMLRGIDRDIHTAQWREHGKAAGPIRNQRMLDEGKPDLVIAFPGGRGTADMVARAKAAGVEVREVAP